MSTMSVPASILHRPFAVCPPTNLMNPDGFFVVNMGSQIIHAYITNQGSDLTNVRVYIEGISDPGVSLVPEVKHIGKVSGGATFPVRFNASFLKASPGVAFISFIVEADGLVFRRIIKKIFITRVDYHRPSKTYSVIMPEGTMQINIHRAITSSKENRCRADEPFVVLPTDVKYDWIPNPSYSGIRGPFPYADPWWKIALAILAVLLALGALLYDYFSDGTLDGGMASVSGTFDETEPSVSCCTKVETSASSDDWLERGFYSAAGGAASAAIASDGPDIHYRGQDQTVPKASELTLRESVRLKINYIVPPSPGRNYPIEGSWKYRRITTGEEYVASAYDKRMNIHYLKKYEVNVPQIHDRAKGPLRICARFQKPDETYFRGNELYVSAILVSTYGAVRRIELHDDGIGEDSEPNDAWYCGGYVFQRPSGNQRKLWEEGDLPGDWYVFVIAQDVNTVAEGTPPFEAAHTIGGFVLTTQLELNFNAPCKMNHDAVVHVI